MGLAIGHCGYKTPVDDRQLAALIVWRSINTTYQVIFLVCHYPWPFGRPMIPGRCITIIGSFHGAVAIISAVGFGVSVVIAATAVIMMAVNYPILAFGLVVYSGAFSIVLPQTHTRSNKNTINFMAHYCNRRHI